MTGGRRGAVIAGLLVADLLVFGGWIGSLELTRRSSRVLLPVEGFDPRDLLSGHYVRFRLVAEGEANALLRDAQPGSIAPGAVLSFCLEERGGRAHVARRRGEGDACKPFLSGRWRSGGVRMSADRFYVDERRANEVAVVRGGPDTYVVAALDASGEPQVIELVVEGKPLRARVR